MTTLLAQWSTAVGDLYVGRCEDEDEQAVILLDADMLRPTDELSREDYLKRAYELGFWNRFPRLELERSVVASIRRLGDLSS